VFQHFECHSFYVRVLEEVFMKLQQLLKRLIPMLLIALFPVAGAQSLWGGANVELPFSGGAGIYASLHVGVGYNLPLGLGTIGLEVTPFALRFPIVLPRWRSAARYSRAIRAHQFSCRGWYRASNPRQPV
jgi:hypothetical protein